MSKVPNQEAPSVLPEPFHLSAPPQKLLFLLFWRANDPPFFGSLPIRTYTINGSVMSDTALVPMCSTFGL